MLEYLYWFIAGMLFAVFCFYVWIFGGFAWVIGFFVKSEDKDKYEDVDDYDD